jgi:hypothetical protein
VLWSLVLVVVVYKLPFYSVVLALFPVVKVILEIQEYYMLAVVVAHVTKMVALLSMVLVAEEVVLAVQ